MIKKPSPNRHISFLQEVLRPCFSLGARRAQNGGRQVPTRRSRTGVWSAAVACGLLLSVGESQAVDRVWNLFPGTNDWNTDGNWTPADFPNTPLPDPVVTDTAVFGASTIVTPNVSATVRIEGIRFDPNAPAYTITNSALASISISGTGITNNSGLTQTITNSGGAFINFLGAAVTAGTNVVINNSGGAGGRINFTTGANAGSATINNIFAGSRTLFSESNAANSTINNIGTSTRTSFTLTGTAGNATITNSGASSLIVFVDTASGGTASLVNANATAIIDISQLTNAGMTVGSIAGAAGVGGNLFLGSKNLAVGGNGTSTLFSGVIQDGGLGGGAGGSLTKVGGGTLTLTGANIYTGGTTVSVGVLQLGNGGATGSIVGDVVDNSTLAFNRSDTVTFGGVISGMGAVQQIGAGTTIFTGANTYGGGTTINAGILQLGNGGVTGSIVGDVVDNAALAFNRSDVVTFGGVISGTGSVHQNGTGTTIFTGANTYGGGTTINSGILQLGNGGATGSIMGNVIDNSSLAFNRSDVVTFAGMISGTGSVHQNGTGTTIFTGANTYGGGTTINAGILQLGNGGATGSIMGNVVDNSSLAFNRSDTVTFGGAISGAGNVHQNGTGTTIFTAANTYGGGTTINAGTLVTQNASALGSGPVALNAGILAPTGVLNVNALNWNGGNVALTPAAGDIINIANAFTNGGAGGGFQIGAQGLTLTTYTLATFSSTNFILGQLSAAIGTNPNVVFQHQILLNPSNVQLTILGATATGPVIQNPDIPVFAVFTVNGPVTTAGRETFIKSLTFNPGSSLTVPNTLTVTSGNFDVPTGSTTITGNVVLVPGDFNLNGAGSLDAGANFFIPGAANVNSGALLVNGNFNATQGVNVFPSALLGGTGAIGGNVSNHGMVQPGMSAAGLTVSGNYLQFGDGTLLIQIGGRNPGQFTKLTVTGTATLGGTLQIVRLNNFQLTTGEKITFLTAAAGVNGTFATVNNEFQTGTTVVGRVLYESNAVSLITDQASFLTVPQLIEEQFPDVAKKFRFLSRLTFNQEAVARALDSAVRDGGESKLIDFLNRQSLPELPGDFDRIAPEELTALYEIVRAHHGVFNMNILRHNEALRNGANGFSSAGLGIQGNAPGYSGPINFRTGVAGPTGNEGKDAKEDVYTPTPDNRWGVFITGVGEWVDVGNTNNARGYDIQTGGFTVGVDYKITPNFALGMSAGYAGTGVNLIDDGRIYVNGGKLGVYATYFTGGFYVDAAATAGYNSYETKRRGLQGVARGDTDGGEFNGLLGAGYDIQAGNWSFGPTANVQYSYMAIDDFREHGSLAPLAVREQDAESLRSAIGFRTSYDLRLRGVVIRPEVRAAWQHEFSDRAFTIDSGFASGAGNDFTVRGPEIGRDSLLLSAGVSMLWSDRVAFYLYYDGQLARTNYDSHSVSGGVRVAY
jgi:outer membrane autotransporter protein